MNIKFIVIIILIICLIIVYINLFKKNEFFNVTTKSLTDEEIIKTCILKQQSIDKTVKDTVISEKNFFYNNPKLDLPKINCNKICIIENNGNIECITKDEIIASLNLPGFRRHAICIDDVCLTKNVINKINGNDAIRFKSISSDSNYKDKCVGVGSLCGELCGGPPTGSGFDILDINKCYTNGNFRIHHGLPANKLGNLDVKNYDLELTDPNLKEASHNLHKKQVRDI